MARRPEFYFDEKTGYYRKRVKLQNGTYKDVRAKSKEELRAKLYELETAQRMGVILDDKTTVAQLLAQWYANRKDGLSYSRRRVPSGVAAQAASCSRTRGSSSVTMDFSNRSVIACLSPVFPI